MFKLHWFTSKGLKISKESGIYEHLGRGNSVGAREDMSDPIFMSS